MALKLAFQSAAGGATAEPLDWANLVKDILTAIARLLPISDYANFASVCASWAAVASPKNGMPPPLPLKPVPYLLLAGHGGEQSESCTLLDVFDDNRCYKIDPLPEIRGKWFVGSQFGYLALLDDLSNPSLLNPLTRSRIDLPPISTLADVKPVYNPDGSIAEYLYCQIVNLTEEREFLSWPLELFRTNAIRKLVLSSPPSADGDFAALAITDVMSNVIYVPPGGKSWDFLEMHPPGRRLGAARDILCREDGKFLILGNSAYLQEVDISGPSATVRMIASGFSPHCDNMYLVELDGDLLLVCRLLDKFKLSRRKNMFRTVKFDVWRLDSESCTWVSIHSLGDKSLFVGASYSVAFSVKEASGLKPNCIYCTDDFWDILPHKRKVTRDVGIYNLDEGSFELIHPPNPRRTWPPPIWIIPSLQ